MRKSALVLAAIAVLTVSAVAEDIWFMNGVYKLDVPAGWRYQESDNYAAVALYPEDKTMHITVTAPNLEVDESDFRRFAGLQVAGVFKAIGSGKILNEEARDVNGFPASCFVFSVTATGGDDLRGMGFAVYFDGVSVVFFGLCHPPELKRFAEIIGGIVDSYAVSAEAIEQNKDLVRSTSRRMLEKIEAEFGDWKK